MQEGQDQDFEFASDNIGDRATTEYFSKVEGGKKNKEKIIKKRTRFTRKTLFTALGIVIALAIIFVSVFTVLNLRGRNIGKRTDEELPTTMTEVRRRTYEVAYNTGQYYDGIVYLKNLILDMRDSNIDANFIFEAEVFLARFIREAGDTDAAVSLLDGLESREYLTDRQKYWLYGAFVDIYRGEGDTEKMEKYVEMFNRLNINYNNSMDFITSSGGSLDE